MPVSKTIVTPTRRSVLAGAAASLPLLGRRARAAEPIRIGWVGPLSPPGGYAEGTNMKNAAMIAAEEINAAGGILGRQVEITYADTRGMPAEGRTGAERLIQQDKVVAVFGEFHSPVALAEMEVYHKYGTPFMACDVWSDQITAKGYPEVFRNAPAVSLIDVTIGQWIAAAGFKNVAIIAEKDDVGLAARTLVQQELTKAGVEFTAVDADPNLTDFTAQILRFKSASPPFDFFLCVYAEAGAYPMIRQAHDLGFAPTASCGIYNSGGEAVDPTFWENVGAAGQWLVTENVGLPKASWNDKTKAFVAKYHAKQNADPSGAVMESYDGAYLLFDAIKRAGGTDAKGIINALETTSYVGVRGKYSFSTSHEPAWHYHQFLEAPLTLLQYSEVKQGQAEAPIVWPKQYATVPYVYKKPGELMTDYLLIQALNGLVIGIIYAVIAAGLTVIFSILKIVNFAHGEVYMMGGYFAYFAIALAGIPPLPAVLVAMVIAFVLSVLVERTLLTPLYSPTTERKGDYGILVTFGISIFLRALALIIYGPYPLRPPSFWPGIVQIGDLVMTWDRVFAGGAGIAMLIGLVWFMNRTPWGEALNAVSQSRESAAIVGINDQRFYMLAFGLGGALAGGAGALVGPIYSLSPSMGLLPDTQAFAIVILGGMGSVAGSILAGLLIGVSESMFVALFPDPSRSLTYAQAFSLLILMLVLLIRPTGLFGRAHVAME